jgi:transcriptional regulator with XRE-family HTH domain
MKTAADFLDDLRAKFGLTSDYQVAKLLGMQRQQVARYRKGQSTFDDTTAARIAEMLGIDAGYVAACMNAQRAQTDQARRMWERAAKVLAGTALAILAGCTLLLGSDPGAFDITQCFALLAVPESVKALAGLYIMRTPDQALLMLAGSVMCALLLIQFKKSCSARSR